MTYKFNNARILVVDDMAPMQTLLRSMLSVFGFKDVDMAENGEEGFEKFCRYNPDLILTDWVMDPINGIEMVEKIRTDPDSPNRFVPILLMTGFMSKIRVEHARDKGVTEFVVKPFTAKDLYARIEHAIEQPRSFVDSRKYFGPDRRRHKNYDYRGKPRRSSDFRDGEIILTDRQHKQQSQVVNNITRIIRKEEA